MCTRAVHVEIVTSLDLNNFLLAFSRFTNLRGAVGTVYSDNGSTFCAAAEQLPKLINFTDLHNSLRKRNINWIKIPLDKLDKHSLVKEGVGKVWSSLL